MGPIEWSDIDAFCRNTKTQLSEWEIELIEMLDDLLLASQSKVTEPD